MSLIGIAIKRFSKVVAQSQCRTTLEALAEIKNPRAVAFLKQANIAVTDRPIGAKP